MLQLLLRHGRLKMHRSQHPIAINSGGLWVVNNGLVKVTYTPNVGTEQQYFLGSGTLLSANAILRSCRGCTIVWCEQRS